MRKILAVLAWSALSAMAGLAIAQNFTLGKALEISKALVELGALLFGAIGMWISLLYRDEIVTNLWTQKNMDEQLRAARLAMVAQERCEVLYRGICISAVVIVGLYAFMLIGPDVIRLSFKLLDPSARMIKIGRYILSCIIAGGGVLQLYVLLSSISPMMHIRRELRDAGDCAKRIVALAENNP